MTKSIPTKLISADAKVKQWDADRFYDENAE
jgi:hypothetical protein